MPIPPACCAGTSFNSGESPQHALAIASEGVITPRQHRQGQARAASTRPASGRRLTPNAAPAAMASSKSLRARDRSDADDRPFTRRSRDRADRVPTPQAAQRHFQDAHHRPPPMPRANGTACVRSLMTITGITGPRASARRGVMAIRR